LRKNFIVWGCGHDAARRGGNKECSFLKKRTKKLLLLQVRRGQRSATANKGFLLLFFKKEVLPVWFSL
jgi:hypothetical protein